MQCPTCGTQTYTSIGGFEICPQCGYGSPTVTAQRQEFEEYKRSFLEKPGDRLHCSGEWSLKIVYKAHGTKSEAPHGVLYKNDEVVEPDHAGEIVKTELGILKYYAHLDETMFPWEITGWNFADPELVLPSWR